jgi:hypothetical protein
MAEILKDNARQETGEVYGAMAIHSIPLSGSGNCRAAKAAMALASGFRVDDGLLFPNLVMEE